MTSAAGFATTVPKMELVTSHNKTDLVNLATSRQLDILAANNPARNREHGMAMSLTHSLSDIDLRKSRLLRPLALSRPLHMHLATSPLPVHLLGWTDPATSRLLRPLALSSPRMPTRLLRPLSPAYAPASLHRHNRPAMDLLLRPLALSNSLRTPAASPCASHHRQ